jgi:putative ABC transport system ATP-binding protein
MIDARRLSRSYTGAGSRFTLALDALTLPQGAFVAVAGPSGCGKSTLLGLLALALAPDPAPAHDDVLRLDGQDALAMWRRNDANALATLRARTMGFVPQTSALLPFLTLRDNILLPQQIIGRVNVKFAETLANWLRIDDILHRRPAQVSVGQRQRAAIARALAHRPSVVLADEPTASVHPTQADEILGILTHVVRHTGAALIISTHDPARAQAAGFSLAPCQPDPHAARTTFRWPPGG